MTGAKAAVGATSYRKEIKTNEAPTNDHFPEKSNDWFSQRDWESLYDVATENPLQFKHKQRSQCAGIISEL